MGRERWRFWGIEGGTQFIEAGQRVGYNVTLAVVRKGERKKEGR